MKNKIALILLMLPHCFMAYAQENQEEPLWELGLFTGAARLPLYRGSDEYQNYLVPLPYFVYRGRRLRADREGLKGIFWSSERAETALSIGGSPPSGDDSKAREGMPELGAVLEVGPGAKIWLSQKDSLDPLYIRLGVRGCVSADTDDLDLRYEGIRGDIRLIYKNETLLDGIGMRWGAALGVDFADRGYNGFIYDVDPVYATAERPAYQADSGYSGLYLSLNAVKEITRQVSIGAYYRWDNISGAVYEDSPLVREENNHVFAAALIWKFWKSERTSIYTTGADGAY